MPQPDTGRIVHYRAYDGNTGTHPLRNDADNSTSRCQAAIVIGHGPDDTLNIMVIGGEYSWERHDCVQPNTATASPFDTNRWHGIDDHHRRH